MQAQGLKIINNMQIETSAGTVYWQEEEPTDPKDNDTWFKVVNGTATNAYNRVDGAWVETEFASQIIAEELVGKIITAAEINGGVINGTTISGAEFINKFSFKESDQVRADGQTSIINGKLSHDVTGTVMDTATGEESFKGYENHYQLYGGQMQMQSVSYDPTGKVMSAGSAILTGDALQLTLTDNNGEVFVGSLTAKALTSAPWEDLKLASGWKVGDNNPPQYRIIYELNGSRTVQFRGAVAPTSGTISTSTAYPFVDFPAKLKPPKPAYGLATSQAGLLGRVAVSTAPSFMINMSDTGATYAAFSTFSYSLD